jgi:hypothetical protein
LPQLDGSTYIVSEYMFVEKVQTAEGAADDVSPSSAAV